MLAAQSPHTRIPHRPSAAAAAERWHLGPTAARRFVNAELRSLIDRVVIPALVDRFLREVSGTQAEEAPAPKRRKRVEAVVESQRRT
jgi:hypothetical protein